MAFFSKKKNGYEAFKLQLEKESIEKMNQNQNGHTMPISSNDPITNNNNKTIQSPTVMTAEEILGKNSSNPKNSDSINMSRNEKTDRSADFLYKRMLETRNENIKKNVRTTNFENANSADSSSNSKLDTVYNIPMYRNYNDNIEKENAPAVIKAEELKNPEKSDVSKSLESSKEGSQNSKTKETDKSFDELFASLKRDLEMSKMRLGMTAEQPVITKSDLYNAKSQVGSSSPSSKNAEHADSTLTEKANSTTAEKVNNTSTEKANSASNKTDFGNISAKNNSETSNQAKNASELKASQNAESLQNTNSKSSGETFIPKINSDAAMSKTSNKIFTPKTNTEASFNKNNATASMPKSSNVKPSSGISQTDYKFPEIPKTSSKDAEKRRTSLLARCNAFLEDDDIGVPKINTEKYKLESVDSILKDFETRASQRVMKKFSNNPEKITSTQPIDTTILNSKEDLNKFISSVNKKSETDLSKTVKLDFSNTKSDFSLGSNNTSNNNSESVKHFFVSGSGDRIADKAEMPLSDNKKVNADFDIAKTQITDPAHIASLHNNAAGNRHEEPESNKNFANNAQDISSDFEEEQEKTVQNLNLNDYKDIKDKDRIFRSLFKSRKKLGMRVLGSFILLIASVFLTITPFVSKLETLSPAAPAIYNFSLTLLAIVFNFNIIRSFGSLFNNQSDTDLPFAIACVGVFVHSISALFASTSLFLSPVLILSLLFSNLAKRSIYNRAIKNFALYANDKTKLGLNIIGDRRTTGTLSKGCIDGGSVVALGTPVTNATDFMQFTFCSDPVRKKVQSIKIIGLILGLGLALATIIISAGNIILSLGILGTVLCVAAAPTTLSLSNFPLKRACDHIRDYGAVITGYKAANDIDYCNAVAVSCADLFPNGRIRLIDMKLLSSNPVDQAILDASAITKAINSPVSGVFKQINNTFTNKKQKVDSITYEDKMGVSGWVDDRRVFVGNRILMEAHGFKSLPPIELDKKIMRKGYFPVYVASDNLLCAVFVVKYIPDRNIAYELRRLCNTGTTVLVSNCDPNINSRMLCDYFGLYEGMICVMSKQGSDEFEKLKKPVESKPFGALTGNSCCGLFATVTAAINLKKTISLMSFMYVIFTILGIMLIGISLFSGSVSLISSLTVLAYQLISSIIILLPPILKR